MQFINWLESEITKSECNLFATEGLLKRAREQGYSQALKDCKKEYERSALNDGR